MTAALAQLAAEHGKRVLACEIDAKGDLAALFEAAPTTFVDRRGGAGRLWRCPWTPRPRCASTSSCTSGFRWSGRIGPLAKAFDFVATAAPGVREILTVGKLCYEVRERHYDLVVVDAPATGHIVGQLGAPQAINDLVKVGLIRTQTDWMLEILSDPAQTGLVAVTTPEEMPVAETLELAERVVTQTSVRLSAVVVNRVLPELFGRRKRRSSRRSRTPDHVAALIGAGRGRCRLGLRGCAPGRDHAPHPGGPSRPPKGRTRPARAGALAPLPVHPGSRAAHNPSSGGIARRGARVLMAGAGPPDGDRARSGSLDGLLAAKEIVIACGPGGVGKTTTAAALAAMAACQQGGRVLVLTVDPARRLADALGLSGIGNRERRVEDAVFTRAGASVRGELWAAMLDTKESWDALVRRHAPDATTREHILANPLYRNISGRFVQSHDYIAMERLFEIHSEGAYDLIVVDTPPSRNALDFLDAPQRLADFFSSRLLRWLIAPYRSRLVGMASKPFHQVADRILGTQFLADIAEFFILFQSMYDGFVERSAAVTRLLSDRRTTFLVVSTLEAAPVREAEFFAHELVERNLHLGAIVLNKVLPAYFRDGQAIRVAQVLRDRADTLALDLPGDRAQSRRVLEEVAESFLNFSVVARREAEQQSELSTAPEVLATVPFFDEDIFDMAGLLRLAGQIWD